MNSPDTQHAVHPTTEEGPSELPTDEERRQRVRDAFAGEPVEPSTRKVYLRHWDAFSQWCDEDDRTPLPATTETVQDFALAQGADGLAISTIRGCLAAVGYVHRTQDFEDSTTSEKIENTIKRLAHRFGSPGEKRKALRSRDISDIVRALSGSPEGGTPDGDRSGTAPANTAVASIVLCNADGGLPGIEVR